VGWKIIQENCEQEGRGEGGGVGRVSGDGGLEEGLDTGDGKVIINRMTLVVVCGTGVVWPWWAGTLV